MSADKNDSDFWQDHSLTFLEMAFRNDHRERLAKADGIARKTGECGDTVEFFMNIDNDTVSCLSYEIDGCLHTNACCNAVVSMVEGRPLESAWEITPEQVADMLQTLPPDHFHCAELVVGTLYLVLANVRENQGSTWKKMYR